MSLHSLFLRIRALVASNRVERELDEELSFHIERETLKHIDAGVSPVEARRRARARFGPVPLAADECRDARGVSIVDDLIRDILYAFRTFRRAPLAALTIVATVALGLGLVAVVFTIYTLLLLRVDTVRDPGELFAVTLTRFTGPEADEAISFARSDYEAMRRETSVFTDIVATRDFGPPRIDGHLARSVFVTGNFFQMLGVHAALGRELVPDDDEQFAGQSVLVLSHTGWHKLFRSDPAVIGRRVMVSGAPYEIVGVMPEGFRGLSVTPADYWTPLALTGNRSRFPGDGIQVIGRLKPGVSREAAAGALSAWASGRAEFKPPPGHPIQASLTPHQGTLPSEEFALVFAPLFFAFGLILLIGCANVANLLLARGVARRREIGIRLSLGASRRRIIRQLLTESLILSAAAAACGVVIAKLFLDGMLYVITSTLPTELAQFMSLFNLATPASDWRVLGFMVAGAVVSTVFFGLTPALHATRVDLVPTMHGEVTRGARPRRSRHALIALQVCASSLLLICAGIFLRGSVTAATKDPGIRTSDTVRVSLETETARDAILQALKVHPLVAVVAASSAPSTRGSIETPVSPGKVPVEQIGVSPEYFDVLGYDLVSGRAFTPAERTADAGVAIVSDVLARQLWPNGGGIGQGVRFETGKSQSSSRSLTVIGIVRGEAIRGVYVPATIETPGTALTLRVRGNPEQARVALLDRLTSIDPTLINILTYKTMTGMQAYILRLAFGVTVVLAGLALVLTVSGLFSVLSFVVEQQAREIGVRMALGAAAMNVVRLILSQTVRPVGLGLAVGGSLAAATAIAIMATSLAAEIGDTIDVLDPVAYATSLLVIVTSCALAVSVPALRATRIDPIATLRKD